MIADLKTVWSQFKAHPGAREVFYYRSKLHDLYGCEWPGIEPKLDDNGEIQEMFVNWFKTYATGICNRVHRTNPQQAEAVIKAKCAKWHDDGNPEPPKNMAELNRMFGFSGQKVRKSKYGHENDADWLHWTDELSDANQDFGDKKIDFKEFSQKRCLILDHITRIEAKYLQQPTANKVVHKYGG